MEKTSTASCPPSGSWWRLPLLLVLILAAILLTRGCGLWGTVPKPTGNASNEQTSAAHEHVSLTIDFGGGRQRDFKSLAWYDGMTVADLMREATGLELTQMGSGQGAFLRAIEGVANEGADGNNWTYEVNGGSADRSFAVYTLRPGDRVLWTFGPRR